jgi:hypothetical protein
MEFGQYADEIYYGRNLMAKDEFKNLGFADGNEKGEEPRKTGADKAGDQEKE